ncbi:MAG: sulfatase-like hydrolase/transferase [Rhodospirillaceae bacterium]|nr:sulfatase-like hydrolase/transferase [Rhodospirillaceae bacterium]
MSPRIMYFGAAALTLFAVSAYVGQAAPQQPNFLVLVADDLGTETLASYGFGQPTAVTPNLDALARDGLLIRDFWAQPTCSPTRAAFMTGRYAFRTGVRTVLGADWAGLGVSEPPQKPPSAPKEIDFSPLGPLPEGQNLALQSMTGSSGGNGPPLPDGPSPDEYMLPRALKDLSTPYSTGAFGKWHLGTRANGLGRHPNLAGFDHFSGFPFGGPGSPFAWHHIVNGELSESHGYADQRTVDDAADWIETQGDAAWFAWVSFANPHTPVHLPPTELLLSDAGNLDPDAVSVDNTQAYFLAQVEAMDTLIGRLLGRIQQDVLDNTYVIFFGDNGTVEWDDPPSPRDRNKVKATPYEGGVNVPLIVSGPGIPAGHEKRVMGHVVDLFATIIELAGGDAAELAPAETRLDSVSLSRVLIDADATGPRSWAFAEQALGPSSHDLIRNEAYKLIVDLNSDSEEFYHLAGDPHETNPLVLDELSDSERRNYNDLKRIYAELLASEDAEAVGR